ncbi:MAG: hypothetical protein KIT87_29165, partial [Anaerolineae bacterium]|nr:hypothetical protein [Anaerolineae bacterium]
PSTHLGPRANQPAAHRCAASLPAPYPLAMKLGVLSGECVASAPVRSLERRAGVIHPADDPRAFLL